VIAYTRTYRFGPAGIEVRLSLQPSADVTLGSLIEYIPIVQGTVKKRCANIAAAAAENDRVDVRDGAGAGFSLLLDGSRAVSTQANGPRNRDLQVGRVEIALPAALKKGVPVELRYRIAPGASG